MDAAKNKTVVVPAQATVRVAPSFRRKLTTNLQTKYLDLPAVILFHFNFTPQVHSLVALLIRVIEWPAVHCNDTRLTGWVGD